MDDALDPDEITLEMEEILCSGKDLPTVMSALVDYCNEKLPSPGWATLRGKPYAAELSTLAQWITSVLTSTPPPDDTDALYLVIRGSDAGAVLALAASNCYATDGSETWSRPTWIAQGKELPSQTLRGILGLVQPAGGMLTELGALVLGLGWACVAMRDVCNGAVDRDLLLGGYDGRAVLVGFEKGPSITMGVLDDQGGGLGVAG